MAASEIDLRQFIPVRSVESVVFSAKRSSKTVRLVMPPNCGTWVGAYGDQGLAAVRRDVKGDHRAHHIPMVHRTTGDRAYASAIRAGREQHRPSRHEYLAAVWAPPEKRLPPGPRVHTGPRSASCDGGSMVSTICPALAPATSLAVSRSVRPLAVCVGSARGTALICWMRGGLSACRG